MQRGRYESKTDDSYNVDSSCNSITSGKAVYTARKIHGVYDRLDLWNSCISRTLAICATFFLVVNTSLFTPNKDWYKARQAYAIAGIDDATILFGAMLAVTGLYGLSQASQLIDYDDVLDAFADFSESSYDVLTNTTDADWINPTASGGYAIDTSKLPDSVISDIQSFAATQVASSSGYGVQTGLNGGGTLSMSMAFYPYTPVYYQGAAGMETDIKLPVSIVLPASMTYTNDTYRYNALALQAWRTNGYHTDGRNNYVDIRIYRATAPIYTVGSGRSIKIASDGDIQSISLRSSAQLVDGVVDLTNAQWGYQWLNDANPSDPGYWYCYDVTHTYGLDTVSAVPSALSQAIDNLTANINDAAAQLAALNAVRSLNPQVTLPADAPTVINNYTDYVTYTTPTVTPSIDDLATRVDGNAAAIDDLGVRTDANTQDIDDLKQRGDAWDADIDNLNDDVVNLRSDVNNLDTLVNDLGGGYTLPDVMAQLQSIKDTLENAPDFAGEIQGIYELLQQVTSGTLKFNIELDVNLDVALNNIQNTLNSINENLTAILQDMQNLDRSTGDLVDLSGVLGYLRDIVDYLPKLDASTNDLVDLTDLYDLLRYTDGGVTYTVAELLSLINGAMNDVVMIRSGVANIDKNVTSILRWLEGLELGGTDIDLTEITDELNEWHNDFVGWWGVFLDYMDRILVALENLRQNGRNYPYTHDPKPTDLTVPSVLDLGNKIDLEPLRSALDMLMRKFPFAQIHDMVLILTALARPAVVPSFDLPMPNPSDWSSPYPVHVDLSDWDNAAAIVRTGIMLWAVARVTRRTLNLWTREEGK